MMQKSDEEDWVNWSGSIHFTPACVETPTNEQAVQDLVNRSISSSRTIRSVGASHSCSPIFETNNTLLSMENFKRAYSCDLVNNKYVVSPGMTIEEIGEFLFRDDLAMENTGHINKQTIAGAVSTGTHGAGKTLPNLSGQLLGVRMVTGTGEIKEYNLKDDPEIMQALKVSLGSMGVFTQLTLQALPVYRLHRVQYCAETDDCINNIEWVMNNNRNSCFYWYPRRDDVSIRTWNFESDKKEKLPFGKIYKEYTGWGKDVLPSEQLLKFNELEYSVDAKVAVNCFQEIRKRVLQKHRRMVGWRILFRPIAADNAYLSNAFGRDTVAITIHQNASLPFQEYFDDIEPILQAWGGRPHWAKKHSLKASDLKDLYPKWERFQQIRSLMDPKGVFLNNYLKKILIND